MNVLGYEISFSKTDKKKVDAVLYAHENEMASDKSRQLTGSMYGTGDGPYVGNPVAIFTKGFNGEKNLGELGNPINLVPEYHNLRIRAHQADLDNDVVKIITGKFIKWTCGSGLKLQSEPNETVLLLEKAIGKTFKLTELTTNIEAYWSIFANSKRSDSSGMYTLHQNSIRSYTTRFIGGDVLNVLRVDKNLNVTVQVIDGQHIRQPIMHRTYITDAKARGNVIRNGIEINPDGTHVAFYVIKRSDANVFGEIERIEAKGKKSGCLMAWIDYGQKHRIDHDRGITRLAGTLSKIRKLDRYTEATVASAEEGAKIPWYIKHSRFSDGENPLLDRLKQRNPGANILEDSYTLGIAAAQNISVSEEKKVYNMPIGSELASVDSKREVQYDPFFMAIFKQVCGSMDLPPEVALQMYNSNYSASRAAINGFGYIIDIEREDHARNFYQNVYNLWLYVQILNNKLQAPGFLKAVNEDNWMVIEAYSNARFTGVNMPHIDPLKEASAVRKMLGDDNTPLMTNEQASEQLGNGSWVENIKKIKEERKLLPDLLPGQKVYTNGNENTNTNTGKAIGKEKKVKKIN